MRLIFIYGPPASGKLTVAEILSEKTGIPLFHNHLSRDLVKDIYKDELSNHYALVDTLRFTVFKYCVKNNTNLIFTYVYEGENDDINVKRFMEIIENGGGEVVFVELTASRDDLIDRVDNESRKRFKKLSDPVIMTSITEDMSKYTIPFVDALKINTSRSTPIESATLIAKHLNLK